MPERIIEINEKTQDMLNHIKSDIKSLIKECDEQKVAKTQITKTIEKIHKKTPIKTETIEPEMTTTMEKIPRKITISNKKKSRSFATWMFNNKEL